MSPVRRAVIDVGTNSVKLLVAEIGQSGIVPLLEISNQTRLGAGSYETRRLRPEAITATAMAVEDFVVQAGKLDVTSIRVLATSAARDAVNPGDLISAIEATTGLRVEILSGDQEAEMTFRGARTGAALSCDPLVLLDVGGGSTELIFGIGERIHFRSSYPLGSLRLLEKYPSGDPPEPSALGATRQWLKNFLKSEVEPGLRAAVSSAGLAAPPLLAATGGAATILARMEARLDEYDRDIIEATRLSLDRIRERRAQLWSLPLAKRKRIVGLPPKRADVILTGIVIYEAVMEDLGFSELRITTRGLRFAAVLEPV